MSYWDKQFQFHTILPDFQQCLEWMVKKSTSVADHLEFERVAYGYGPRQWYELSGSGESSLVPVFIHGGYWYALNAEMHRFVLPGLKRIGSQQANIEYRLMPEARLQDLINDVSAALIDIATRTSGKLVIVGHSAGGHLAIAGTEAASLGDKIAAVIPISGIFDLLPISWSYLQDELNLTDDEIASSPIQSRTTPVAQTLVTVGEMETFEFQRQAEALATLFDAKTMRVRSAHHMNVLQPLNCAKSHLSTAIHDFALAKNTPAIIN